MWSVVRKVLQRGEKQGREEGREDGVAPRAGRLVVDSQPGDRVIYKLPEEAD